MQNCVFTRENEGRSNLCQFNFQSMHTTPVHLLKLSSMCTFAVYHDAIDQSDIVLVYSYKKCCLQPR